MLQVYKYCKECLGPIRPRKYELLAHCRFNVGPSSTKKRAQQYIVFVEIPINIRPMLADCWFSVIDSMSLGYK